MKRTARSSLPENSREGARSPRRSDWWSVVALAIICGLYYIQQAFPLSSLWNRGPLTIDAPRPSESKCQEANLCKPCLLGASILSIAAQDVHNYTLPIDASSQFRSSSNQISFCNITVTYTHPGLNDTINVNIWLPPHRSWNRRFQGTGGGGFLVGLGDKALFAPTRLGFAAATTDGGIPSGNPSDWALLSPGNVDLNALHTYGSTALADMTILGKQLTAGYYGASPKYSYWNGCSTGGRQGLQLAQSHPHLYDGILATAPAIHLPAFLTTMFWPQLVMQTMLVYPRLCELEALRSAAISACDGLDGVLDGIISFPFRCRVVFDPFSLVGKETSCQGHPDGVTTISTEAATVASATWAGPESDVGYKLWHGLNHEAYFGHTADTTCTDSVCGPNINHLAAWWMQLFLLRRPFPTGNPHEELVKLSHEQYTRLFHDASRRYDSIVGSNNPDLSAFAKRGGKMITWHGLGDPLIMPNGSVEYYESVLEHFSRYPRAYQPSGDMDMRALNHMEDFYRLFLAPGVDHCEGGVGPYPGSALTSTGAIDQLMAWVENGTEPDALHAASDPDAEGRQWKRPLCVWPRMAIYKGQKGAEREEVGWTCEHIYETP